MGFNWKAIRSYDDDEVAHYRLLGEMLRRKATLTDLDQIRMFLLKADLPMDGWLGLGEALHRTTSGSPVGYDIWLAWLETFDDIDVDDDKLGEEWISFGADMSEASEGTDYDPNMDVLPSPEPPRPSSSELPAIEAPRHRHVETDPMTEADDDDTDATSMNSAIRSRSQTHTGLLGRSPTQLLELVPRGPFQVEIFGVRYKDVDEYAVLTLLKRGLFLAARVQSGDRWVAAWKHPAFASICEPLEDEARRILTRRPPEDDATQTNPVDRD